MSHLKLATSATSSDGTAYAEAIEDLDAGMCIVDRDGSVLASNRAFCRLLDLPPDWADPKANKTPIPASEQLVTGWLARVASQGGFAETVALSGRFIVQVEGKALPSRGVSLTLTETVEKSASATGIANQSVPQWVLHDAEENFRGVVENMADIYYHSDLQGNTTFGGPAIGRLLGYEPEEFEALDWRVLHVDPDRRATFLEELERNGGQIRDFEAAFRHKNGEAVWLSSNIRYRYGDDGELLGIEGVIRNISEQKSTQAALRESDAQLRAIIDNSSTMILLKGLDGRFQFVGKQFIAAYGVPIEGVIGKTSHEVMLGEFVDMAVAQDQRVIDTGEPIQEEITAPYADGTKHVLLASKFPVRDDSGDVVGVGAINTDITDRVEDRRALAESEGRFRALLAHSPDSVSLKDATGRFLVANKECERVLGVSVDDMLGWTIWEILPDGDWHESDASDAQVLNGEVEVCNDEMSVDVPGRGRRVLRRTKFPVLDGNARPIGVGTITTDVTDQIEAREQLRRNEAGFKNAQQIARMGNVERNFVTDEAYWSDGVFSIFDIEKRRTVPDFDEVMDHVHPEDRGIYDGLWAAMKAGEVSQEVDFRLIRPTGEVRFVHELLEADYDTEGRLTHCVAVIQDVSEAKLAEVALRDSEQRFRSMIDNLPSAVSLKDRDHRFISVNKSFEILYGRTKVSVVGEPLVSAMPENNDWEPIIAADQEILDGDRATYEEMLTLRFEDGEKRTFNLRKYPVTDDNGDISAVGTISTDITERLRAEELLRDNEERFRSLVDNLPNTVTVKGLDGRFTLVNTAFAQMVGQPLDAIIGQTIGDVVPDMDVELSDSMDIRICNGEEDFITDEYPLTLPNGEPRHIHMTKFPVSGSDGRCTGVGTISTDITEHLRAEHRVRESEAKFHAIFEQAGLGIGVVGRDGEFLDVNNEMADMFGLTPDEMVGESIRSLTVDDDLERSQEQFEALLNKENDIARFEKRYLRKGGGTFEAKLTSTVVFDEDGEFKFTVALIEDVTERRKSERALRESEERLRAITDNSPAAIYLKDTDGKFIFANQIWHDTYNPSGEDIAGKIAGDFISSETADQAAAAEAKVLETGESIVEEQYLPNAEGTWQNLLASKFPVRDDDGNIVAIGGVNTDISDRVATERALQDNEAHLAHAQRIAKLGSWVWDPETDKVTWSDALYRLMQIDPETTADLAGAFFARVHPDDRARVEQSRKQLKQFGHQELVPYRIILPNGEERTIHTQWVVEHDASGRPVRAIGITQDVTEADQAERALRESEQWFRAVIDNVPATLTLKNPDSTFRYVNKQFREWYDLSLEETVGRTGHELFASEVADAVDDLDQAVLETGDAVQAEIPATFADGSAHTLLANKFLVRDDDGTVIGNGLVGYDVTDAKHTEAMLRQAQKMEAVGQLTGGVAHDFNNLLAVVIGNLELVADHLQADTPAFGFVSNAFRAAERGASLTHHLLAFARQQVLQPIETDLTKLIADTNALMSVSMGEKITVELKTGDGLWHCKVDQAQLQNAILNLSINARDAMPSGGSVTIAAENTRLNAARAEDLELDEGDYVCLSVSDNGPGIPEDVLEHVYEPFFTTKDVGEGSGLGLSMVYGFARQSGAGVEIETGESEGTSVKLYFPAIVLAEPKADESKTKIQDQGTEPQATILLVEDNAAFRQVTRAILESLNFRVIDFGTAEEALKVIGDTTPFDLLLSDIGLPGDMDGHDLAQFAASARPGLKIILMSAHTDRAFSGGIIDSNVAAFLRKPHRKADLSQTLHQVFGLDT